MSHSRLKVDLAIDPGSVGTGFAVFKEGRFCECGTVWPKGKNRIDKLLSLKQLYHQLLTRLDTETELLHVAVESWQKHVSGSKTYGMMLCSEARGLLVCVSLEFTTLVTYISKGNTPKSEALLLARARGCAGSEHAVDAVHLGILAGFEKYW